MKHESVVGSWFGVLLVTVLVVGSLVLIQRVSVPGGWLVGPFVLMAGSLIPTLLRGRWKSSTGILPVSPTGVSPVEINDRQGQACPERSRRDGPATGTPNAIDRVWEPTHGQDAHATVNRLLRRRPRGDGLAELGLRIGRWRQNVRLTCMAGVVLGVLGWGGVSVLGHIGIGLPLRASGPAEKWVQWVLFQYVYAALPEELFFRGYLMSGIMGPLRLVTDKSVLWSRSASAAVLVSAAAFALSHALVLGSATAIVTFLPGLAFAWLYARTRSLVGPILLHGTANIAYGLMAGAVA